MLAMFLTSPPHSLQVSISISKHTLQALRPGHCCVAFGRVFSVHNVLDHYGSSFEASMYVSASGFSQVVVKTDEKHAANIATIATQLV